MKTAWTKVKSRLKMPWLFEGDFIHPTRDNAIMDLDYRYPSPA